MAIDVCEGCVGVAHPQVDCIDAEPGRLVMRMELRRALSFTLGEAAVLEADTMENTLWQAQRVWEAVSVCCETLRI